MTAHRDDLARPHVVHTGLAAFGAPGLALLAVLAVGGLLGWMWAASHLQAARVGAVQTGPWLEHLADVGAAWRPRLDTGWLWTVGAGSYVAVVWGAVTAVAVVRRRDTSTRTVRWAGTGELDDAGLVVDRPRPGRIVVGRSDGRLVAGPRTHSLVVFGPSGSAKTSAFAAPGLLEWDGPAVVSTVKTDLLAITRQVRQQHGEVLVYDPLDRLDDTERCGWDPLSECDSYEHAQALAAALVSLSDFGRVEKGDFWQSSAESLLAPLLLAARRGRTSIRDVRRWLNLTDWDTPRELLSGDPEAAESLLGATDKTPADTALSYVATARVALRAYETPAAVASTTLVSQVDLDRLLDGRQTLYLVGDEDDQRRLRPLFVGLIDAIMRHASKRVNRGVRPDRPLLVLLDDAANSAPLQDLDRYASVARDRGIQLVTIWQDLAQIEQRFGPRQARTIVNNHQGKVLLPGVTDHNLLEYMSDLLGDERITSRSTSPRPGPDRVSESETWRPLATPDELRRLPDGKAVLVHGTTRPARLDLRPYYTDPRWEHLADNWHPAATVGDDDPEPDDESPRPPVPRGRHAFQFLSPYRPDTDAEDAA